MNFSKNDREFKLNFGETIQSGGGGVKITNARHLFFGGARLDVMNELLGGCEKVTSIASMFQMCSDLTSLDLSGLDISESTTMESAFESCSALAELNIEGWDTSKVTNTSRMFYYCRKLKSVDVADWDVSNVVYMNHMFNGCSSLERIDMSKWDTSKVKSMQGIFLGCESLEEIIGFSAPLAVGTKIGFPSGYDDYRPALKRLTFRTDIEKPIDADINIEYCSFERSGLVEMFNSLPDISDGTTRYITITGNPCVPRCFETTREIDDYLWEHNLHDTELMFEYEGKRYTMEGNDMLNFMNRYSGEEPFDCKLLFFDTELLTDDDRKTAIRKGWKLIEV